MAHDSQGTSCASHMRQHVCACDTRAHFQQHAKPLTYPKTGNAHNGASRRVDVVIDPYGVLRGACFAVGASIARPRNDPPNMERADANSYPVGFANLHRRVVFFSFSPRTANGRPYTRVCARREDGARTDVRTELFRNSYTFFSASIHNLTVIRHLMHNPKQYVKTQIIRAAGNPKGVRPFWSF